ncbi:class E sortase [Baekduia sp.]|jgi:sortase A|uniref:class E sortase n=1 Tax=Baekduia sp. TaxID=2600305 RepID=UPI002E07CFCE|nr:class E sortase [Baekduia sp.]
MTLDVTQTEYAGGGPGYALVRLSGAARTTGACRLAPPTLLIADGPSWRRLATVPGTTLLRGIPDGAPFAVAFEVPLHLALGDGAWWLEPGPEVVDAARDRTRLDELAGRAAALGAELAALRTRVDEAGAEPAPAPAVDTVRVPDDPDAAANAGPTASAVPVPRRSRLRALRPSLPALLVAAGALAVGDAVATVVWQEPVSALWAAHEQHALQDDLARLDAAYDTPAATAAAAAKTAGTPTADPIRTAQARIRALAHTLESRTTSGKPLGELRIPRLDAHFVVVQGTNTSNLRRGPGHYYGTALPGQDGTVGIAGHRTTYGAPFRHLDALRRGDPITMTMPYGRFVYRVEGTRIVKPQDVSTLRAIGRERLVLTACHPLYSAAQRLVVIARLTQATPRGAAAASTGPSRPGGVDAA